MSAGSNEGSEDVKCIVTRICMSYYVLCISACNLKKKTTHALQSISATF